MIYVTCFEHIDSETAGSTIPSGASHGGFGFQGFVDVGVFTCDIRYESSEVFTMRGVMNLSTF